MKVIDTHVHIFPPSIFQGCPRVGSAFPNILVEKIGDRYASGFPDAPPALPVAELFDPEGFVARLDQEGMTAAVVSLWTDLLGYGLPADEGAAWARLQNEQMMDTIFSGDVYQETQRSGIENNGVERSRQKGRLASNELLAEALDEVENPQVIGSLRKRNGRARHFSLFDRFSTPARVLRR